MKMYMQLISSQPEFTKELLRHQNRGIKSELQRLALIKKIIFAKNEKFKRCQKELNVFFNEINEYWEEVNEELNKITISVLFSR